MKMIRVSTVLSAMVLGCRGQNTGPNPVSKVIELLDQLVAKINKDGEAEAAAFKEYSAWCEDTSKNTQFAIETAEREKARLEAAIAESSSDVSVASARIEELGASIAADQKELKDATLIREKEVGDFSASEKELMGAIDTLGRAISILEKEMAKHPAFAQMDGTNMAGALQAITEVLNAAAFPGDDQKKLTALVQAQARESDESDGLDVGAPAAAQYKTHSTNILDMLEDLKEKAQSQLADLRKAEVNSQHNYNLLKQSLDDQTKADTKDMGDEKADKAAAEEAKATAEGDLERTQKSLQDSKEQLATCQASCMQVSADHDATVKGRAEELKAIAEAKKILTDTTSGAVSQSYSLLQVVQTRRGFPGSEVLTALKQLSKKQHSAALAQLASRVAAVLRYSSSSGEDPFAKVKGLIQDMIGRLEKEAGAEATEKAYCDEQMAKTEAKKGELEGDIAKMTSKIDQAAAKSAELKQEVRALQQELAALAKQQADMDNMRRQGNANYKQAKADLELGLSGVRQALVVLRDYYGTSASMIQDDASFGAFMQQPAKPETHSKSSGAGSSIINILEVVESDFAKNLAREEMDESDAQAEYEKVTQENSVTRTVKESDVKYKSEEAQSQDSTVATYSADRETTNAEYNAVLEYYGKLRERCIAKPETYEDRSARRAAEINGLKEALSILEDETAFVQRKHRGLHFRGTLAAQ